MPTKPRPDSLTNALRYTVGRCSRAGCTHTMVAYVGGGQHVCWLHVLAMGIP